VKLRANKGASKSESFLCFSHETITTILGEVTGKLALYGNNYVVLKNKGVKDSRLMIVAQ